MKENRRRARLVVLTCAAVIGAFLGLGAFALAHHQHTYALWGHGYGYGDGWHSGKVHPFLASTDGAWRTSCVGYQKQNYHSESQCKVDNHNHMNFTTTLNKAYYGASTYSTQTALAHHHHCYHTYSGSC